MDRKSIIILVACLGLIFSWPAIMAHFYPPLPVPPGSTNQIAGATNRLSATNQTAAVAPAPVVSPTSAASVHMVAPGTPEELVTIENTNARYTFTSHGGGIKIVELKGYPETVACGVNKNAPTNRLATLNARAPVPAMALLGGAALQGDGLFTLTKTATGVRAEKLLTNGLYLVKEFTPSTNFLLVTKVTLENRSDKPLALPAQEWVIGSATPLTAHDDKAINTMGMYWYNGAKEVHIQESWFANRFMGCFPGTPRTEYSGGENDVLWAAVHNQFFAMVAMPRDKAPKVVSRHIDLPAPTDAERAADPHVVAKPTAFQTALVYPAAVLEPGKSVERRIDIFAGPKEYHTLEQLGLQYNNNLEIVMNFGGFLGFCAKVLLISMNQLHDWGLNYGLTIVAITVLLKILFWPLTRAQIRSAKRMTELQPQIKAMQEKYKDDPQKMQQKMWAFYKENKVNPLSGCFPLLLQMPVFFGFYTMLQGAIELRGASFLWACDLSSPDTLFTIPGTGLPFNLLPLIMGATSLWQASMTPPSPGMDPAQQKMMRYLPLLMVVFFYNFSAGLALYWTVQNLLSVAQTKLTKTNPTTPAAPVSSASLAPKKKK